MKSGTKVLEGVLLTFIIGGIILAVINFVHFRSLWLDEAVLALNIIKPINELFKPLDDNQVAPIGFLVVESLIADVFGKTDWSMRVFPLLSFLVSVYLMFKASHKIIEDRAFALLATGFYSLSYIVLRYSSEVKQYMTDTTISLLIVWSTLVFAQKRDNGQLWIYALIGAVSVWFSNIAVIMLFTSGLYYLYATFKSEDRNPGSAIFVMGSWIISFVVYYLLFVYDHPTREMMVGFWSRAGAFLPGDPLSTEFYREFYYKLRMLFRLWGNTWFTTVFALLVVNGMIYLGRWKKGLLYLLISPLAIHLLLSFFRMYPFHYRLILYLYPFLVMLMACGMFAILRAVHRVKLGAVIYLIPFPLVINLMLLQKSLFPFEKEEIKKSLTYLEEKVKDGDEVYLYYGAASAYRFYKEHYPRVSGNDGVKVILAPGNRNDWPKYNETVAAMSDEVWILFSHVYGSRDEDGLTEKDYILRLFEMNGYKIVDRKEFVGSSVYKVDKSPSVDK